MNKLVLKVCICISFILLSCSCTGMRNEFLVLSDYDYFKDAGDMGFYKKGDLYGFIYLNGDTGGLEPFTLDEKLSETIVLESITCLNGFATFSMDLPFHGFMDLNGNAVMKEEWGAISDFNSSGYASVYDNKLQKYVIINQEGEIVRDSQSYIEYYYPNPDIFICRDTFDITNSFSDYYLLDKDLHLIMSDLEVYYHTGPELAHTRQYTIWGDSEKFIYKKNNRYFIHHIKRNQTISEYDNYDLLLKNQKDFIEKCQQTYVNHYEHSVMTESYNGVFIHYDESTEKYLLTNENGRVIFEPDQDITGLTYLKGKVIQGKSKSTGKTVVIFNQRYK